MTLSFDDFVLAASTGSLSDEHAARPHADAVEFRLDVAEGPDRQLEGYDGELPLVLTNRPGWEGGRSGEDEPDRLEHLAMWVDHPAVGAIDVELEAVVSSQPAATRVLERAREAGVSVIVSSHDFETTPGRQTMREILKTAGDHGDVGKLAVTAERPGDVLALLEVTYDCTEVGRPVATMAMGAAGRHSRAVAPIYGSRIGYAPVDPARATAPGQYDLRTLAALIPKLQEPPVEP